MSTNIISNDGLTSGDKSARRTNDVRLQDIEVQLEMAESRCNNLKDQLDHMKQLYGVKRPAHAKQRKSRDLEKMSRNSSVILDEFGSSNVEVKSSIALPNRQKSNHIGTDTSGAAVRTINNILNGITNSVNRLVEIHSQSTTPRVNNAQTSTSPKNLREFAVQKSIGVVPELDIESNHELAQKAEKPKNTKNSLKKHAKIDKNRSLSLRSTAAGGLDKRSSTLIKNRILSRFNNAKNAKLVEIYHNEAVKQSDSDESNLKKSKPSEVPPINIQILSPNKQTQIKSDLGYINGFIGEAPLAPRISVSCCYPRNYELPTVASKMKQVAKSYLNTLNLKTIPFCAAISTTQSHNIGINIQQVMNIIKNRQPINGISPTLAHNIGLAAEKLNSKPFAALVSTINSKISQTVSKCPLSRTYLNVQQLQEQARHLPEDTIEEADENVIDSPQTQSMFITGPSGDVEIKTKKTTTWKDDKSAPLEQCTCVPAESNIGMQNLNLIQNKYNQNLKTITQNSINSQFIENQTKKRLKRHKSIKNRYNSKSIYAEASDLVNNEVEKQEEPLNGREKNLKEVLSNLHDDFSQLNHKYEDLSQKSQTDGDETTLKELEKLESELNKKEEEITMVMTLYKEVLALKHQVKELKEKRSQASLPSKEPKDTKIKFKEYNNPEAAFHLTKLLKQIQHYQMRYKSNLSQE